MEYVTSLMLLIGAAGLLFVFYGPWQHLVIDSARNRMFEIRDDVFDMAVKGDLDFASIEYREIRDTINSLIRFAHKISWPWLIPMFLAVGPERRGHSGILIAVSKIHDPKVRAICEGKLMELRGVTVRLLAFRSPIVFLLWLISWVLKIGSNRVTDLSTVIADELLAGAEKFDEAERKPQLQAA